MYIEELHLPFVGVQPFVQQEESALASSHLSQADVNLLCWWLGREKVREIVLAAPLVMHGDRRGEELNFVHVANDMTCGDFCAWLGLSSDQASRLMEIPGFRADGLLSEAMLNMEKKGWTKQAVDDPQLAMDGVTKSKFMSALDLIQRRAKDDGESLQLEKVRWADDSSESDWIAATELRRKQVLMPLEAAI